MFNYKRGYCKICNKRTTHSFNNEWICLKCLEKMGLEETTDEEAEQKLKIVGNLTPKELSMLIKNDKPTKIRNYSLPTSDTKKIGIISDTHIGHEMFDEGLFKHAGQVFRKEKVEAVYHSGDILEGMSGRDGQVFELAQIGFSQQINYAEELFKKYFKGLQVYGITGNHDDWYKKRNNGGISVGEELEKRVPNFHFLGENEADVTLNPGITMKLFHPGDGTAYATSYKLQKLIESLSGGKKPNLLVEGHYHKALYMFNRNVHGIEAGTLCGQTGWMRGKKIPAHKGFWILDMEFSKRGIKKLTPSFYPSYD